MLWRAGLRIHEALALAEADLDPRRGSLLLRRGKGGRRREVGMDDWGWEQLAPWLQAGASCRSVRCSASSTAPRAGGRGRPPPRSRSCAASPAKPACGDASRHTQLRHAHAVEMAREGVPLIVIQRQLGHTNLGITSIYLQGIDNSEIIDTVHARRAPMVPVHSSLQV